MNKSSLSCLNLIKYIGSKKLIDDVSITVNQGSIVGLLGCNGAGKTTTFKIISGLEKMSGGKIILDNTDLSKMSFCYRSKAGLGYLPQKSSIFTGLTVAENILAALQMQRLSKSAIYAELDRLTNAFCLQDILDTKGNFLSGGERRRVEIARALATFPKFILLDEPFAGVDPIAISDIQKTVFSLKQEGLGVLITDHNAREILNICDYIYVLNLGKLIFQGTAQLALQDKLVRKYYLGESLLSL